MVFDFPGTPMFGDTFILRAQLTDTDFYTWMAVMGDERDARKYFATISLFGKATLPWNKVPYLMLKPFIP